MKTGVARQINCENIKRCNWLLETDFKGDFEDRGKMSIKELIVLIGRQLQEIKWKQSDGVQQVGKTHFSQL